MSVLGKTVSSNYTVLVLAMRRGGEAEAVQELYFTAVGTACSIADRMQGEFDADGEPYRVYVVDHSGVRIWAGGARGARPTESNILHQHART